MFLRRVLVKYWITYISITLFTILAMVPIYLQTYSNVKTQQLRDTQTLLQSRFDAFLSEYASMQRMVKSLQSDRTYVLLSNWSGREDRINLYHYIKFHETLQETVTPSNLILDVYVLFAEGNYAVNKRAPAMVRADFYARELSYPFMDFDAWQAKIWQEQAPVFPFQPVKYFQSFSTHASTFLFYTGVKEQPNGIIAVVVDEAKLHSALTTEDVRTDGQLRLMTGADRLTLYAYSAPGIAADDPINGFTLTDEASGLTLTAGVHERIYAEATRNVRNTMMLYIGIALFVSLLLSGAYTVNVYLPVRATWAQMRREGMAPDSEKNFHRLMSVSMAGLLTRKQNLEKALEEINSKHRDHLITNIVYGMAVSPQEVDTMLRPLPILQGAYSFVRLTIQPGGAHGEGTPADVSQVYGALHRLLLADFGQDYMPLPDIQSALIALPDGEMDEACIRLEGVAASLHAAFACQAVFAVSQALQGVDALREGWAETTRLIRFADIAEGPVLRMDRMHTFFARYDLLVFQPEVLLGLLSQKDTKPLVAYLNNLLGQLTSLHFARPRHAEQLYGNIADTCHAALRKHDLPAPAFAPYNAGQDILLTVQALREAILDINRQIRERHLDAAPKRDTVLDYIREHFADPNLSLAELAEAFHYSEGYIYQIVKKQTGLSYADYVNSLRMERASDLLRDGELPTADVAQQSGFHNVNTFYKAFKKRFGMAPKAYRDQAGPSQ